MKKTLINGNYALRELLPKNLRRIMAEGVVTRGDGGEIIVESPDNSHRERLLKAVRSYNFGYKELS